MTRAEKVTEAQRLRGEGLLLREIAERMGAKLSTVHAWLSDPDLSKHYARRAKYSKPCPECGNPMDGSDGPNAGPVLCKGCIQAQADERLARVLTAWGRGDTAEEIAEREGTTANVIGSLVDRARRLKELPVVYHRLPNRSLWPQVEEMWNAGVTAPEIARELGLKHANNVHEMLKGMRRAGFDVPLRRDRKVAA